MRSQALLFSGIMLLVSYSLGAQFRIESEFRPRFEIRDGYKKLQPPGAVPALLVKQRFRLSFSYRSEDLYIKLTPQDARVWGDEQLVSSTGVFGDSAALDLYEAFAGIRLGKNGSVIVGRQELVYDQERLLSKRNWNHNGLTYDAVVFKFSPEPWEIHAGGTWNSLGEASFGNLYREGKIKTLDYIWMNYSGSKYFYISGIYVASGVPGTDTTDRLFFRHTAGSFFSGSFGHSRYRAEVYLQTGKNYTGEIVSAWLTSADFTYKIGSFKSGLGATMISGDKNPGSGRDRLFDQLYGSRHRYLGHMDYFSNLSASTHGGGITDLYGSFQYAHGEAFEIKSISHAFFLGQVNERTPAQPYLGFEQELEFSWTFSENGSLKAAWLMFFPSEGLRIMQEVPGTAPASFAFLELTINPVLLVHSQNN